MRLNAVREALLKPLQQVAGVVEKRSTMPVLANVLIQLSQGRASFVASDTEIELRSSLNVDKGEDGEITIQGKKLVDLVRSLADGTAIDLKVSNQKATLSAARSKFTLSTLPANTFPHADMGEANFKLSMPGAKLKELLERTAFAMALQDVRYYLNGLLLELRGTELRAVATDGHRLSVCDSVQNLEGAVDRQLIVPRKAVLELIRMLAGGEEIVQLEFARNHLRASVGDTILTTKLIDGRFPEYNAVIPVGTDKTALMSKEEFKTALQRVAILSNEKYRGVRIELNSGLVRLIANNPEQDEAVEEVAAECSTNNLGIGFNVNYLLDAVNAVDGSEVMLCLRDSASSCLLKAKDGERVRHVVMPLRL
ncbi:DNA polymerase III subunit beta [bacterium]|nr:DNA polymerase III subunit beta [bacterium]